MEEREEHLSFPLLFWSSASYKEETALRGLGRTEVGDALGGVQF